MKTKLGRRRLLLAALFLAAANAGAAGFTNLHNYSGGDGSGPAGLRLSGDTLYGTAADSTGGEGTVFTLGTDGTGFTNLHNFSTTKYTGSQNTNVDGAFPGSLMLSGSYLFGVANGGDYGAGAVFKLGADGSGFTNVFKFGLTNNYTDGGKSAVLSGDTIYGRTGFGGTNGGGTLFSVNTNGTGFTNLHSFPRLVPGGSSDGTQPNGLLVSGDTVYGTTTGGGSRGGGTVYKTSTDGTGFTPLYEFTNAVYTGTISTNIDGADPGGLVMSGNTLYGTTGSGGSGGNGTVFKVNADGTGFATLHTFSAYAVPSTPTNIIFNDPNNDGADPVSLVLSGNTLYGTTLRGGSGGEGTIFRLHTDGSGFANLYSFSPLTIVTNVVGTTTYIFQTTNSDGAQPGGLVWSGNTLYGTATYGGTRTNGTVFAYTPPPDSVPLNIQVVGGDAVLTWGDARFSLQCAPFPGGAYTNVPGATSPYTCPITGAQMVFRLQAN